MSSVSTPCIGICVIDPVNQLCEGCGRTLDEIARWASLGEAERLAIMSVSPGRLKEKSRQSPAIRHIRG